MRRNTPDVFEEHARLGPMKVDKGQFDTVLKRLLKKPPQKTAEIRAGKKGKEKTPRPSPK